MRGGSTYFAHRAPCVCVFKAPRTRSPGPQCVVVMRCTHAILMNSDRVHPPACREQQASECGTSPTRPPPISAPLHETTLTQKTRQRAGRTTPVHLKRSIATLYVHKPTTHMAGCFSAACASAPALEAACRKCHIHVSRHPSPIAPPPLHECAATSVRVLPASPMLRTAY